MALPARNVGRREAILNLKSGPPKLWDARLAPACRVQISGTQMRAGSRLKPLSTPSRPKPEVVAEDGPGRDPLRGTGLSHGGASAIRSVGSSRPVDGGDDVLPPLVHVYHRPPRRPRRGTSISHEQRGGGGERRQPVGDVQGREIEPGVDRQREPVCLSTQLRADEGRGRERRDHFAHPGARDSGSWPPTGGPSPGTRRLCARSGVSQPAPLSPMRPIGIVRDPTRCVAGPHAHVIPREPVSARSRSSTSVLRRRGGEPRTRVVPRISVGCVPRCRG